MLQMNLSTGVHQLLPVLEEEDAIGNYALNLRDSLREEGFDSRIFVYETRPGKKADTLPYLEHRKFSTPNNILIFHTAIGSPLVDYFIGCPDKKLLIHHNITPARFFAPWDREVSYLAHQARQQLAATADTVLAALADSSFNARELAELGYPEPEVVPLIFNWERLNGPGNPDITEKYGDGKTNLLFVGRIAPNKKQEDLLRIFSCYQKLFNPESRLILVGDGNRFPSYQRALNRMVHDLNLKGVIFTGKVSPEDLRSYYRTSSLFLCASEHEGFGVPLVESLFYRLPVVAYDAGAVGSTLGEAGVLVKEKDPIMIAGLINRIMTDNNLRGIIIKSQDRRLEYFKSFPYREKWNSVIKILSSCKT
jgi:L-malate glycosyltransferase